MRKVKRGSITFLRKGKGKSSVFVVTAFIFLVCDARGQNKTGTIIVAGVTDQEVAIAADSLIVDPTGNKMGNECKIAALGPKFLLSVSGSELVAPPNHPESRWDPYEAGREAMRQALLHPELDSNFAGQVATIWTNIALQRITSIENIAPNWFLPKLKLQNFDTAFFGGVDSAGHISLAEAVIDYRGDGIFTSDVYYPTSTRDPIFVPLGRRAIYDEFTAQQTARAQAEAKDWKRKMQGVPMSRQISKKAIRLVELTIKYGPPDVGGPIAAATISTSEDFHWIQKTPYCK